MRHFWVTLLLLAVPTLCSAEIYRWVDEKGRVGYSDDLGRVPKKYRNNAVVTERQEQAVETIESSEPEKSPAKGVEVKGASEIKERDKDKPVFDGKPGDAWKQDFARLKHEVKSLEDQAAGIKERMADASKISRGEYVILQNTQRDLDFRMEKARQKLDALNDAAEKAGVPAELR